MPWIRNWVLKVWVQKVTCSNEWRGPYAPQSQLRAMAKAGLTKPSHNCLFFCSAWRSSYIPNQQCLLQSTVVGRNSSHTGFPKLQVPVWPVKGRTWEDTSMSSILKGHTSLKHCSGLGFGFGSIKWKAVSVEAKCSRISLDFISQSRQSQKSPVILIPTIYTNRSESDPENR